MVYIFHVCLQKSDGTCNTDFKKTKYKEEVMKALGDFVDRDVLLLVYEDFIFYLHFFLYLLIDKCLTGCASPISDKIPTEIEGATAVA